MTTKSRPFRILTLAVSMTAVALIGSAITTAQEPLNYRHFPVTTELQKILVGNEAITDVVFVNGGALRIKDGRIDETSFDFELLRKELKDENRKGGTLGVYPVIDAVSDTEYLLNRGKNERKQWSDFAKSLGFERSLSSDHGSIAWKKLVSDVEAFPVGDAQTKEDVVQCKGASLYPVRTSLSRFLTMNADCVVDITTPIDAQWDGVLDPDTLDELRKAADKIKFDHYGTVHFRMHYHGDLPKKAYREFSNNLATARELGFGSLKVHHLKVREKRR